jgi:hypothetical protein
MAVPHDAQNLAVWAFSAWQLGHTAAGGAMALPQDAQNLAPAVLAALQLGQVAAACACWA